MSASQSPVGGQSPVTGTVRCFNQAEGWGVIDAPEVPGGCFVHFSDIRMDGYHYLDNGQSVSFTFEQPRSLQDGYSFRAVEVWPL